MIKIVDRFLGINLNNPFLGRYCFIPNTIFISGDKKRLLFIISEFEARKTAEEFMNARKADIKKNFPFNFKESELNQILIKEFYSINEKLNSTKKFIEKNTVLSICSSYGGIAKDLCYGGFEDPNRFIIVLPSISIDDKPVVQVGDGFIDKKGNRSILHYGFYHKVHDFIKYGFYLRDNKSNVNEINFDEDCINCLAEDCIGNILIDYAFTGGEIENEKWKMINEE
jgi:hypothetical protein